MNHPWLVWVGFSIIFVGFLVVALGTLLGASGSNSSVGGFVLIGPIPIIFGAGPEAGILATIAILISVVMVAIYLMSFFYWKAGKHRD